MSRRILLAAAGAAALALTPGAAHALLTSCTAVATGVAFGTVTGQAAVQAAGNVRVTCEGFGLLNSFTAALSTGSSGVYSTRRMQSGARTLNYNLYTSSARTTIFGNGSGGSSTVGGRIDFLLIGPSSADVPVFGLFPAQGRPAPGAYTDTITVTITY